MGKFVFVCGPHGSGKSTILKSLYERGVISQCELEIGKELYYKKQFKTEEQGYEFEKKVTEMELERDLSLVGREGNIGVETWHPGNLAYVVLRNPNHLYDIVELMKSSPFIHDAIGVWLRIPKEVIMSRTKTFENRREWAGMFYEELDNKIEMCLDLLGLLPKTKIMDANRPIDEILEEVSEYIQQS